MSRQLNGSHESLRSAPSMGMAALKQKGPQAARRSTAVQPPPCDAGACPRLNSACRHLCTCPPKCTCSSAAAWVLQEAIPRERPAAMRALRAVQAYVWAPVERKWLAGSGGSGGSGQ